MKIIFLDIDGVLNFEEHYKEKKKVLRKQVKTEEITRMDYYRKQINLDALRRIEILCDLTGAQIVISSTWRKNKKLEEFNEIFRYVGLKKDLPIIGMTDVMNFSGEDTEFSVPRGCEIKKWLYEKGFYHVNWSKEEQLNIMSKSQIENYLILDDDSDFLYSQRNHFVHVFPSPRNKQGFNDFYLNQALDKLSKTIIELNYE